MRRVSLPIVVRNVMAMGTLLILWGCSHNHAKELASKPFAEAIPQLLPQGMLHCDILESKYSSHLEQIMTRMITAMQSDPDYALRAIQKSKAGQPLAYDPKFGLTKEEYDEFIAARPTMETVGHGDLNVRHEGSRILLDGGTAFPELTGMALDTTSKTVKTPDLTLKDVNAVDMDDPQRAAIGRWSGWRWDYERLGDLSNLRTISGRTVHLTLGVLKDSGRGILLYEEKAFEQGNPTANVNRVLSFDLP